MSDAMINDPEHFYLGPFLAEGAEDPNLHYESSDLTTHGVIVGMTGSGKTGLGMIMLEEALLDGIPCLVIDPKGDMGNLLMVSPDFAATDFGPWVTEGTDPAGAAELWQGGTQRSGIDAVKGILEVDPGARVVMCSALGQESLVMEALQAGAKDFIVKPFRPDSVLETLDKLSDKQDD